MENTRMLSDDLSADLIGRGGDFKKVEHFHSKLLASLVFLNHHDEVCTRTNLRDNTITWSLGIKTWLGYQDGTEKEPLPGNYLSQLVHPFLRNFYQLSINAALLVMTHQKTTALAYRFVLMVPMRNSDGKYLLVKQITAPFDYDKDGQIATCLNSYTIVGDYRLEIMKIDFFQADKELKGWQQDLRTRIAACIKIDDNYRLNNIHRNVINAIRSLRLEKKAITGKELARKIPGRRKVKIKPNTAVVYQRMLAKRLVELMQHDRQKEPKSLFPESAKPSKIIEFFEGSGLLDYLYPQQNAQITG